MFYWIAGIATAIAICQLVSTIDQSHPSPARSQSHPHRERSHHEDRHEDDPHDEDPRQERLRDEQEKEILLATGGIVILAAIFFFLLLPLFALGQFASADDRDPPYPARSQSHQFHEGSDDENHRDDDLHDEDSCQERQRHERINETLYCMEGLAAPTYVPYRFVSADDGDPLSPTCSQSHQSHERPQAPRHEHLSREHSQAPHHVPHYVLSRAPTSLRAMGQQEGRSMELCLQQSQEAYERRDHALAKSLSEEGRRYELKMEQLHAEASTIVFESKPIPKILLTAKLKELTENNHDQPPSKVDLHGLTVKEAIKRTEEVLANAPQGGVVHLIVGQGNHSDGGTPKLKPAIRKVVQRRGLGVKVDPGNPGVLVVVLDDGKSPQM